MKNIKIIIIIVLTIISASLLFYTWALKRENDLVLQENFDTRKLLEEAQMKLTHCQNQLKK